MKDAVFLNKNVKYIRKMPFFSKKKFFVCKINKKKELPIAIH